MSQLIGCYLQCSALQVGQIQTIEGPLFTVGKRSQNGDRIPPIEAERLKKTLIGSPIRYCPAGIETDGVVAEHYCDRINDKSSIVGTISAISSKTDEQGREVIYATGSLKSGVRGEALPKGWSLFAQYETKDDDSNILGTGTPSITVLDHPAFDEAVTKVYAVSASGAKQGEAAPNFSTINTGDPHKEGEAKMATDKDITPPEPPMTPPTAPVAEKAATEVIAKSELERILSEERARIVSETKETMSRERFAAELADKKASLNLIKPEDKQKAYESLMRYSSADLQTMLGEYEQISKMAREKAKSEGITGKDLSGLNAPIEVPTKFQTPEFNHILTKLGTTPDIFKKQLTEKRF